MENDDRQALLNGFLHPSHGKLPELQGLHSRALGRDPLFYGHLAGWYRQHGSIRDHHELFVAHLLTSKFSDHRQHGKVLLQHLRPYQVARVVRYTKETLRYQTRILRSAVRFYLKRREAVPAWLEECVVRDRHSMKYLYATLRLAPGELAEQMLFGRGAPGRLQVVRELQRARHVPRVQAGLIRDHKIHFTTAMGTIKHFTPEVLSALVSVMTPQQVINNLGFLEKRGGLACDAIRLQVEARIKEGVHEARVSDFKALVALSSIKADPDLRLRLYRMTQERLRSRGRITVPTALLVDKSGSMQACIEAGKRLAMLVSSICDATLYVEVFDHASFSFNPQRRDLLGWERAFEYVVAAGCTSIGAPVRKLMEQRVEQFVIVSDGEENEAPFFGPSLEEYQRRHGLRCRVIFLKVNNQESILERNLANRDIDLTVYRFNGDYYNLPNVVALLCAGARADLVEQVMNVPLFRSVDLRRLAKGFDEKTLEVLG